MESQIRDVHDKFVFFRQFIFTFFLVLYMNDLLAAAKSVQRLNKFWKQLSDAFKIQDLGVTRHFLAMEIKHIVAHGLISLSQYTYIQELALK